MEKRIKELKFKRIGSEALYLSNDFFSTSHGHYIFKASWVLQCPKNRFLGLTPLAKKITNHRVKVVSDKLAGLNVRTRDLESTLKGITLDLYREVPRETIKILKGHKKNNFTEKFYTHMLLKTEKSKTYLDVCYGAALFFDESTKIMCCPDGFRPVVLLKNNEIVAIIAPLNPEKIEEFKKHG